jgi:glutamate:GABA antiporter
VDLLDVELPYFPGILYFGAGTLLVAFGRHGQALAAIVWLNIRGIKAGKWLNNICSIGIWLPVLLLVALAAVVGARYGSATHFTRASLVAHISLRDAVFWSTIVFAFSGCEAGSIMGEEIENSQRTLPRALLLAGIVVAVAYFAGTVAMLVALPSTAVAGVDGFMQGTAQLCVRLSLPWLSPFIAALVTLSAVGGAAAYLSATSRLPSSLASIAACLPPLAPFTHATARLGWPSWSMDSPASSPPFLAMPAPRSAAHTRSWSA